MEFQTFSRGKKGNMKYKLLILATLISMCTPNLEKQNDLRVVSLSTTHTEVIQALGGEDILVGVDSYSLTKEDIKQIDAFTVTAEELLGLNPDLVLIAFDFNGIVEGMKNLGINYALLPPVKNFEEVYLQIETVGSLIKKEEEAKSLVSLLREDVESIIENSKFKEVTVFHEIGYTYGIYTVNSNSFIGEIYNLLGVNNIANKTEDTFASGYPQIAEEKIIKADPDLIVVGHSDYLNKDLSTRPDWKSISAVENGRVYFLDENLANNWGVSTVDLLNVLSEVVQSNQDPGILYLNKYFDDIQNLSSFQLNQILILLLVMTLIILTIRRKQKV